MNNKEDKEFVVGSTSECEMCNYYVMYWVLGDRVLRQEAFPILSSFLHLSLPLETKSILSITLTF